MKKVYGQRSSSKPDGMGARILFPVMALMDTKTPESFGRRLWSSGGGVRDLPLSIYGTASDTGYGGHSGAVLVGRLDQVTLDDDTKVVSGEGWMLDTPAGNEFTLYVASGAQRGNSVDLAEVKASYMYSEEDDSVSFEFTDWKIAKTTLVSVPAFGEAYAEIDLVADASGIVTVVAQSFIANVAESNEMSASGGPDIFADVRQPSAAFFRPEPESPVKLTVTDDGDVYGHLALWNSCHSGYTGKCVIVPKSRSGYASFNKPGVPTDQGDVEVGPIFLSGGHRMGVQGDLSAAYGGTENAWADVRVTDGKLGPWLCGRVRPGVDPTRLYTAKASRVSGHWQRNELRAIVSVNGEGYDVPGKGTFAEFSTDVDGNVLEMAASFWIEEDCGCDEETPDEVAASMMATLLLEELGE